MENEEYAEYTLELTEREHHEVTAFLRIREFLYEKLDEKATQSVTRQILEDFREMTEQALTDELNKRVKDFCDACTEKFKEHIIANGVGCGCFTVYTGNRNISIHSVSFDDMRRAVYHEFPGILAIEINIETLDALASERAKNLEIADNGKMKIDILFEEIDKFFHEVHERMLESIRNDQEIYEAECDDSRFNMYNYDGDIEVCFKDGRWREGDFVIQVDRASYGEGTVRI